MAALFRLLRILGALTVATVAQAQGIDRASAIDTEHIFGFTEGADIGGKGEGELESITIGRLGRPGSFAAFTNEIAFRYGLAEHFRASFGALADYHSTRSVPDLTDRAALNFSGLSSEFRWQLLERVASPADLTLSFSPEWRRIDDTSGESVESYALPIVLLADTALVPNAMFAAINLTSAPAFTHTHGSWQQDHPLEISPAIAAAITDGVFLAQKSGTSPAIRTAFLRDTPFLSGRAFLLRFRTALASWQHGRRRYPMKLPNTSILWVSSVIRCSRYSSKTFSCITRYVAALIDFIDPYKVGIEPILKFRR